MIVNIYRWSDVCVHSAIHFLQWDRDFSRVDCDRLGAVVGLVDPDQSISQFKHVVTQGNDDELGILCPFLKRSGKTNSIIQQEMYILNSKKN